MDAMVNADHYTIADIYHLPEGKRAELSNYGWNI